MKALLSELRRRHVVPLMVVLVVLATVFGATAVGAAGPVASPPSLPSSWVASHPIRVLGPGVTNAFAPYALTPPFTPAQIRKAYGIDQLADNGTGKTIAIVIAYRSNTIQADLNAFCAQYGLAPLTLTILQPYGVPPPDAGWAMEMTLDVEWAHAIAPGANIILVEALSNSGNDLINAVDFANTLGADVISMSWGMNEFPNSPLYDGLFSQPGVTYFAASGDSGAGVMWPAVSARVVAVGGTTLTINDDGTYGSETAWSNSGGGISSYVPEPSYQSSYPIPNTGGKRGVPDVSFVADPTTGVPIYYNGLWYQVGGTSLSAPCWAALSLLANQSSVSWVYSKAIGSYATNYHDITSGSNGGYSAGTNYDFVTGLGSPKANYLMQGATGHVAFFTSGTDVGSDPNLSWDNTNKKLGIGTASPFRLLHLKGNVSLFERNVNSAGFIIERNGPDVTGYNRWVFGVDEPTGFVIKTYPWDGATAVEQFVITKDDPATPANESKVGIGLTSPQYKLDVRSDSVAVYGENTGNGNFGTLGGVVGGVLGHSSVGPAVYGYNGDNSGVLGGTTYGVSGNSASGNGVSGNSTSGSGVYGTSGTGYAGYFDGKVQVDGSLATAFTAKSDNYTATANDSVIAVNATSGAVTITLPASSGISGRVYTIKKVDSSEYAVTVDGSGAETIDGAENYSLVSRWNYVTVVSDGANWLVVGNN
jgi:hypothetical protein